MNLALFDFDGTITSSDTFPPFIRFAVPPMRMVVGAFLLSPLLLGYKLGLVSAAKVRAAIVYLGLRGRREADLVELGARYSTRLQRVMRREALERIAWHKEQGDRIVVVSASLDLYLRGWCEEARVDLLCSELASKDGILTGKYLGSDCTGREKAKRVLARYDLTAYSLVYAYGDSAEDHELLALASKRYLRGREIDP